MIPQNAVLSEDDEVIGDLDVSEELRGLGTPGGYGRGRLRWSRNVFDPGITLLV